MMEVLNIPIPHVSVVSIAVVLPIFKDMTLVEAFSKKIMLHLRPKDTVAAINLG